MTAEGWLVVIDLQRVFADPDSPWAAPRFAEVRPADRGLAAGVRRPRRLHPLRRARPSRPAPGRRTTSSSRSRCSRRTPRSTSWSTTRPGARWSTRPPSASGAPSCAAVVGDGPLTVAGVATDCCVLSTALAAADAGVPVRWSADACAGSTDDDHDRALRVMSLYAPLVELTTTAEVLAGAMTSRAPPAGRAAARRVRRPAGPGARRRDDGATLLGGSPLRLLRLSPRARALLRRRPARRPRRDDRRAGRPAAGRRASPHPDLPPAACRRRHRGDPGQGPAGRAGPAARRAARRPGDRATCPWSSWTTARRSRSSARRRPRASGTPTARGPAAARNAGLRGGDHRARRLPRLRLRAAAGLARSGCAPHLADPRLALVAPRIVAARGEPRRAGSARYEAAASALDMGAQPAPVRPLSAVSYVPSAALLARRAALGDGFDESMRVAEDVDLVWRLAAAGWRVRYEPARRRRPRPPRRRPAQWLRRRAFYGTGAALLAARHGSAGRPAGARAVVGPGLGAGAARGRPGGRAAAAGVLGRRPPPGWPGGWPGPASRRRWRSRPGWSLRGTAAAGAALARAVTRHHWPVALAAAVLSRRARRAVAGRRAGRRRRRLVAAPRGVDRCASPPPAGWRTSPTAPGCGGAPSGTGSRGRCCPPVRR